MYDRDEMVEKRRVGSVGVGCRLKQAKMWDDDSKARNDSNSARES